MNQHPSAFVPSFSSSLFTSIRISTPAPSSSSTSTFLHPLPHTFRTLSCHPPAVIPKMSASSIPFSNPDQPARYAQMKRDNHPLLDVNIDAVFDPTALRGKRVLVTGANRGIGLKLIQVLDAAGAHTIATCRDSNDTLDSSATQVIMGVDVQKDASIRDNLLGALKGQEPIDVLINNAGYFMKERESVLENTMDFDDEVKTIDICAVGILRVSTALVKSGLLKEGSKIACITSQGGSIQWRDVQCPNGGDYGHHMSKAAANMAAKLLANELKAKKIIVSILHPGFNRTEMTAKYEKIWDIEGAVDPIVGAKRVLHQINQLNMDKTGLFLNCEDGLQIPW